MVKASLTISEGMAVMRQYCNYQERCHRDVRTKGLELGFRGDALEEIISGLIIEKLLDEERYARALARGKFRMNEWGRIKITQALKLHSIPPYCIRKAMEEIDESEYLATLKKIIQKKWDSLKKETKLNRKKKAYAYAAQKGYESSLIAEILSDLAAD